MKALTTICRSVAHFALPLFAVVFGATGAVLPWLKNIERARDAAFIHVPVIRVFGADGNTVAMSIPPDSQLETVVRAHPGARPVTFSPSTTAGRTSEAVLMKLDGARTAVFVNPHLGEIVGERRVQSPLASWTHALHTGEQAGRTAEIAAALLMFGLFALLVRETTSRRVRIVNRAIATVALAYLTSALACAALPSRAIHRVLTALNVGWPGDADAGAHHSTPTVWRHPADPPPVASAAPPRKITVMKHDESGAMVSEQQILEPAPTASTSDTSPPRGPPDPATLEWCGAVRGAMDVQLPPISLARVAQIAAERNFPVPYEITLPATETSVFTLRASGGDPSQSAIMHLDQYEGTVLADARYGAVRAPGRFATWLAAVHDGAAFGQANRYIVSIAALSLIVAVLTPTFRRWRERERTGENET